MSEAERSPADGVAQPRIQSDFLDADEIAKLGLRRAGRGLKLSRHALFFMPESISIGDNTRIDAFCIVSAGADGIAIGCNVHISAYTSILGQGRVDIGDYCTISVRCSIFSSNDDFSGIGLPNPTHRDELRNVQTRPVRILAHVIVGSNSVILPGVVIGESAAIGAFSLVKTGVPAFAIAAGVPAHVIGTRSAEHRALVDGLAGGLAGGSADGLANGLADGSADAAEDRRPR